VLALAGFVGLLELRRDRTRSIPTASPQPAEPPDLAKPARTRHRARRAARVCFVLSAAGVVALPIVWFNTRPAPDVGALAGLRAARAASPTTAPLPVEPAVPPIRTFPARLQDQPLPTVNRPVRVRIPSIGVDASTAPVGVVPETRLLESPSDAITLGWYRHGPSPGQPGSALIAGHVDFGGRHGVFFELARLEPGATVTVDYEDGSARTWRVIARRQYDKAQLPTDIIFARSGPPTLALVTCGGLYDEAKRSYRDNVVVFTVPA
jgi:hypothetical protein